ncbi:PilZ domain-containing protein [Roseibium aquae]|nr:PilZ domain-containing protein [Roseibium aquae]
MKDQRLHPRRRTRLRPGKIATTGNTFLCECTIYDVSDAGARLRVAPNVVIPDEIIVLDEVQNTVAEAEVRWRDGLYIGVAYVLPPADLKLFSSEQLRGLTRRYYGVTD